MSIATAAVLGAEKRLPKVIDARKHGMIDYFHAAFFFGMALMCRKNQPRTALAALLTGSFVLGVPTHGLPPPGLQGDSLRNAWPS